MKRESEVEALLDEVDDTGPSKWPGMTYEQGVANTLRWVLDQTDENPMED